MLANAIVYFKTAFSHPSVNFLSCGFLIRVYAADEGALWIPFLSPFKKEMVFVSTIRWAGSVRALMNLECESSMRRSRMSFVACFPIFA